MGGVPACEIVCCFAYYLGHVIVALERYGSCWLGRQTKRQLLHLEGLLVGAQAVVIELCSAREFPRLQSVARLS